MSTGKLKAIRTEADYKSALGRADALMNAEPGTPEGDELDILADLIEHYEAKYVPMGLPAGAIADLNSSYPSKCRCCGQPPEGRPTTGCPIGFHYGTFAGTVPYQGAEKIP